MDRHSLSTLHGLALALGVLVMVTGAIAGSALAQGQSDGAHAPGLEHRLRADRERDRGGVFAPPSYDEGFYSHAPPPAVYSPPGSSTNVPPDIH